VLVHFADRCELGRAEDGAQPAASSDQRVADLSREWAASEALGPVLVFSGVNEESRKNAHDKLKSAQESHRLRVVDPDLHIDELPCLARTSKPA
jgi:hypothetical protein